jgi:hypothetical protein
VLADQEAQVRIVWDVWIVAHIGDSITGGILNR